MRIALIKKTTLGGSNGGSGLVMYPSSGTNCYIVDNIAEFDNISTAQAMATNMSLLAVSIDDLPVAIGDTYSDGRFYRDGQEVSMPEDITIQMQQQLVATASDMAEILVDQEYRLILLELGVV